MFTKKTPIVPVTGANYRQTNAVVQSIGFTFFQFTSLHLVVAGDLILRSYIFKHSSELHDKFKFLSRECM